MWPKVYKDYPPDTPLKHEQVESGKSIIGCEMHELNGWGDRLHVPKSRKNKGFFQRLKAKIKHFFFRS